jgi:hypothetical protein
VIESKEDAAKRDVKSPDRAEAVMLAFSDRTPAIMQWYKNRAEANAVGDTPPYDPLPMVDDDDDDLTDIYWRESERLTKLWRGGS